MLALSLWLTCAALGDPPVVAAAPPVEVAAPAPVPEPPAAFAIDAQGVAVVKDQPAPPEPRPAETTSRSVLTGFLPADRPAVSVALGLGTSFKAVDGGVDVLVRYRGVLAGVIVAGSDWGSNSDRIAWTRTLGLEAGYAWAPARYRVEGALGYGKATERRDLAGGAEQSSGQFLRVRLAVERVLLGGEGWRVAAGAGAWWRRVQGLSWSPADHQEFGVGLRIAGDLGW
jgi:hypothetical protein